MIELLSSSFIVTDLGFINVNDRSKNGIIYF